MKRFFRTERGFTLIELIVVISIIGILASLLVANFVNVRQKTRDGVRKKDLEQIRLALETYRIDVGEYPVQIYAQSPVECTGNDSIAYEGIVYMEKVPCDPGSEKPKYEYLRNSILRYELSACIENSNDQDQHVLDDLECESGKSYLLNNP
jgi:general secretion pathway protein G